MDDEEKSKSKPFDAYDIQRIRLEKLFTNIHKPVEIPETKKERKIPEAPDFVRNVMGSSAGAGSGEFHVYRQIRSREFSRIKRIEETARQQKLDEDFGKKLEDNKRKAEEATEKNRLKRLKKKEKARRSKLKKKMAKTGDGCINDDVDDQDSKDTDTGVYNVTKEEPVEQQKYEKEDNTLTQNEQPVEVTNSEVAQPPKPKKPTVRIIEED